jgi:hypothetical protein
MRTHTGPRVFVSSERRESHQPRVHVIWASHTNSKILVPDGARTPNLSHWRPLRHWLSHGYFQCYFLLLFQAGITSVSAVPPGCYLGGTWYAHNDPIPSPPCNPCYLNCRCRFGDVVYDAIFDCAIPPCSNPVSLPGRCCPICPLTALPQRKSKF